MVFLLSTGQVYAMGVNKSRHFVDSEQYKSHDREQLIPFHDSKDQIIQVETFKRNTIAVTRKGRVYAVGDKLKKMLKIKNERFGFYRLPLEEPKEEGEEQKQPESGLEEKLLAKKIWVSRCKGRGNYVIYCLFYNEETKAHEMYALGKSQGSGLLGLGENAEEALCFKKITFPSQASSDEKPVPDLVIDSPESTDVRCGVNHTIFCFNNYEQVYVLGCYDKGSQSQEEIAFSPKPLKLCEQFKVLKLDTERSKTVIVAKKKDT